MSEQDYSPTDAEVNADKEEMSVYLQKQERMESERKSLESHWQECMNYIVPRKNDILSTHASGDKRGNELFDTTAIMANALLSSALHSMLTNAAVRFFDLVPGDQEFMEDETVTRWLQDVADRMFSILNASNFQTEVHEIYIDLGSIGTACLYMGDDEKKHVHFGARAMKEIFVDEDNMGLISTVHRKFEWTPRQIYLEFGEKVTPPLVMKKYKEGNETPMTVIHAVHEDEAKKAAFKYKSCYFLKDEKLKLSTGGFHEFPYAVPRWTKTSGEKYGRGPGMDMLPDIKMVNKMMETTLQGAQMTVNPPLMVADDGVIGRVRLTPGGLTVVRPLSDVPIKPLLIDARIDFGVQMVEDTRKRIRAGFFVDQLQLNEGPQMTATEVAQRTEEKSRLMGPVLGRQHFEFLRPLVDRVFGIMNRKELLPPVPAKFQGKVIDVRYSSLLARAQRMNEGQNLTRAISVAAPIVNADPRSMDVIDADKVLRYVLDIYGVPQKLQRDEREIKQRRDAQAKAQAAAVKQQQEAHQADVASKTMPGAAQLMQATQQQQQGKPQ